jgi:hypothetical protein
MTEKRFARCVFLTACIAFVALPALASATNNVTITHPTGTVLAAGQTLKGTNVGDVKFIGSIIGSSTVTTTCSTAVVTGPLNKNNKAEPFGNETAITLKSAKFSGTGAGGDCKSDSAFFGDAAITTEVGNGVPFCLFANSTFLNPDEIRLRGGECTGAARSITIVIDYTTLGVQCKYERPTADGAYIGSYRTDTNPSPSDAIVDLKTSAQPIKGETGNNTNCPVELWMEMSLTFETDIEAPAPAVYFS